MNDTESILQNLASKCSDAKFDCGWCPIILPQFVFILIILFSVFGKTSTILRYKNST